MAIKKTIVIDAKTDKAEKEIKDVNKALDDTAKAQKETNEAIDQGSKALDKFTGGALSAFNSIKKGVTGAVRGFTTLKGAIAATGIGALVVVVGSLAAALTTSEEGQNKLNKALGVAGAILGNVVDKFADFGDFLIRLFSGEGEAMKSVKTFFDTIRQSFVDFGSGIGKLFKLDFKGAVEDFQKSFKPLNDTIKAGIEGTKDFIKEQVNEANAAAKVADMRAKADKLERQLLVERSKREQRIAELRLKSRQEDQFSAEERRKALLEAQSLEDELLQKEVEALKLRADAQTLENTFARSNKENLDEEARLRADVNRQIAARTNQQRQTQRELNRLNRELEREEAERIKAQADFEKSTKEALAVSKEEQRKLEIEKEQEKYDSLIQQAIDYYGLESKIVQELTQAKLEKKQALELKFAEEDRKIAEETAKKKKEAEEKLALEQEKIRQEEIAREQAIQQAKQQLSNMAFGAILANLEQGSAASKAIAVAQATYDTYQAIQSTFAAASANPTSILFPAQPYIQAGAAAAFGFANIRKILATQPASASGGGSFSGSVPSGGAPSVPNVSFTTLQGVGDQITNAIEGQNNRVVQAYVTTSSIDNANQLNRKVTSQATFG